MQAAALASAFIAVMAMPIAAAADQSTRGTALYTEHCQVCHQADGRGAQGVEPPLQDAIGRYAGLPGGREYLVSVPLTGMTGMVEMEGMRFLGRMPSFAGLTDEDIAEVLRHVLAQFNGIGDADWLTPQWVAQIRSRGGSPGLTYGQRTKLARGGQR